MPSSSLAQSHSFWIATYLAQGLELNSYLCVLKTHLKTRMKKRQGHQLHHVAPLDQVVQQYTLMCIICLHGTTN